MLVIENKTEELLDKDGKPTGMTQHEEIPKLIEEDLIGDKALKEQAKRDLKVTNNQVIYDADSGSLVYMNAVANLANFKFINALYLQMKPLVESNNTTDAMYPLAVLIVSLYETVYKTQIDWKGADNESHKVQIESLAETIEIAMMSIKKEVVKI
ncbi:hypothetical protein [Sulfurimonas sp.]